MQLKRSYDIQLHYIFMTSINYACVKVKLCPPIIDFFSIYNKKVKTNDNITDNKDSNNHNKCISVTVSVKTVNKKKQKWEKVLKTFYNLTPGVIWYFEPHGKLNPGSIYIHGIFNPPCMVN